MEKIKVKYTDMGNEAFDNNRMYWYDCEKTSKHRDFEGNSHNTKELALKSFLKKVIDHGSENELINILKELPID